MATLSSDALDAIKSRAEAVDSWVLAPVTGQHPDLTSLQLSAADIPALLAEVERLTITLEATQKQLEIRIAENMPGGRYSFEGAIDAAKREQAEHDIEIAKSLVPLWPQPRALTKREIAAAIREQFGAPHA